MPIIETGSTPEVPLTEYQLFPDLLPIQKLRGYIDLPNPTPQWGDRLALYHPVTSQYLHLTPDEWAVLDSFTSRTVNNILPNLDQAGLDTILEGFRDFEMILHPHQDRKIQIPIDQGVGQLYLELSELCNFRCTGCAVGTDRFQTNDARSLDHGAVQSILQNAVESASQLKMDGLNIKWAGGEPTLPKQLDIIRSTQDIINRLRTENPHLPLTQTILTNGTFLTADVVNFLKQHDIHTAISLWGLGKTNDNIRGARRPQDRYDYIVAGIRKLHESGASFNLNHVVTPDNAAGFADFVTTFWDTDSDKFIAKEWHGSVQPLPLTISLFRPQTSQQHAFMQNSGYRSMLIGIRQGFAAIHNMIQKGVSLQRLDDFDFLHLGRILPSVCGVGRNLLAVGPGGYTSCHQHLFGLQDSDPKKDTNLFDFVNDPYRETLPQLIGQNIKYSGIDPKLAYTLALHGGAGCPDQARHENGEYGNASSTSTLYAAILPELLSLEVMRSSSIK